MDIKNRTRIDQLYFFSLIAVLVFLPWSMRLSNYACIVMVLSGLLTTGFNKKIQQLRQHPQVLVFFLFYFLYVIGLLYAPDISEGLNGVEQKLGLFIIPFIITSSVSLKEHQQKSIMLFFVYSSILLTVACVSLNIILLTSGPHPQVNFDPNTLARFQQLHGDASPLWMEFSYVGLSRFFLPPTYLSTLLALCVIILAYHTTESKKITYLKYAAIAWLVIVIVLSSARIGIILLIGAVSLNLLFFLLQRRFPLRESLLSMGSIGAIILLIALFPVTRFRVIEEPLATPLAVPANYKELNSINLRVLEWKSGIEEIKEHGFIGTGTGGTLDALQERYEEANFGDLGKRYNSHNQYIETYLEIGLPGFLAFISCLVFPLIYAIKHKNKLLLTVVLMVGTACLTTCLLEKTRGLMFFVLFVSLFMFTKHVDDAKVEQ